MKTLFCIVLLVIFGVAANFLSTIVLNLAGLIGALIANKSESRSGILYIIGTIVAILGQSYVYLAYVTFIVNWTVLVANREDVFGILLYPFAFLAVIVPAMFTLSKARFEARETGNFNAQVEALHFLPITTFISFFLFIFVPIAYKVVWGWVLYVR